MPWKRRPETRSKAAEGVVVQPVGEEVVEGPADLVDQVDQAEEEVLVEVVRSSIEGVDSGYR